MPRQITCDASSVKVSGQRFWYTGGRPVLQGFIQSEPQALKHVRDAR